MIITKTAYPRAGLIGNPSDGYWGKTISFTFSNFRAEVKLYESPELEIVPSVRDHSTFRSVDQLVEDVNLFGYYGGVRLLKATIKSFSDYCKRQDIELHNRNFTVQYDSNIPHLVGLAGSSAIITACCLALMEYYDVSIDKPELANLILAIETDELGISAGLQDRVVQVYQGLVYMDFDKTNMEANGYGTYESLDPNLLPPLYIAYKSDLTEGSEILHSDLRVRFSNGDNDVLEAVSHWAGLTDDVLNCLKTGKGSDIGPYLDSNFDRRASVCNVSDGNQEMIGIARDRDCSAKFTGSGGAIVGTYKDELQLKEMRARFQEANVAVIKPDIVSAESEGC